MLLFCSRKSSDFRYQSSAGFATRWDAYELIIIDDFGIKKLNNEQILDLMEIIEDRHGRTATIIASQLPVSDWYDVLEKNATVADAILDRLAKTSHKIDLRGYDKDMIM